MSNLTHQDLPRLTEEARAFILQQVEVLPGYYTPRQLVGAMESGAFSGIGKVVTYWGADNRPHTDAPGAVALWELISEGKVRLTNEWYLEPAGE